MITSVYLHFFSFTSSFYAFLLPLFSSLPFVFRTFFSITFHSFIITIIILSAAFQLSYSSFTSFTSVLSLYIYYHSISFPNHLLHFPFPLFVLFFIPTVSAFKCIFCFSPFLFHVSKFIRSFRSIRNCINIKISSYYHRIILLFCFSVFISLFNFFFVPCRFSQSW